MHDENLMLDQETAGKQAYEYFYRNDPGVRDFCGPIVKIDDPVLEREMRCRTAKIGMVRGAKPENMRDIIVYLDPVPHIRLDQPKPLQGWYSSKGDSDKPNQRDRPCMTDAVLTQPYGGWCSVGCTSFCYVMNSMYAYRASGLVSVPLNYGAYVRRTLAAMKIGQAGYFSSFTDPFMPIEDWYHNTRDGATAFVEAGLPIFFLSRRAYPGWAFDLLTRNPYSYMQKSLNTPHEDDWHQLSPGASSLAEHFEQIREARARGIYVSIQVNPVIPGVASHEDIELLFEKLAEAGTNHCIVKFVESNHASTGAMVQRLMDRFGDNRMAIFKELMVEHQAGNQTTISETYRREGHERYRAKATALGMTYSLCYEYTKRDGRWRSMGPEFITSEQCHGQRVPWHTKTNGHFSPMEVCPPSGCLSCADESGKGQCGSTLLGSALALKLSDFKKELSTV